MADTTAGELQRFRPTNGRGMGYVGLGLCVLVAIGFLFSEPAGVAVSGVLACAFVAGLIWLAMLRPSVAASSTDLHLRTVFENVSIPLASIEGVAVRRYLLVRSGGRRYICPAISRSLRKTVRTEMNWRSGQFLQPGVTEDRLSSLRTDTKSVDHDLAYPDFVEERITALAANDRARRGIEERSEEEYELGSEVVRHVARLELGVLVVLAVAFVVSVFIG